MGSTWAAIVAATESHQRAEVDAEKAAAEFAQAREQWTASREHLGDVERQLCEANDKGDEHAVETEQREILGAAKDYLRHDLIYRKKKGRNASLAKQVKQLGESVVSLLREVIGDSDTLPFPKSDDPDAWKDVRLSLLMGLVFSEPYEKVDMETVGRVVEYHAGGAFKRWVAGGQLTTEQADYCLSTVAGYLDRRNVQHKLGKKRNVEAPDPTPAADEDEAGDEVEQVAPAPQAEEPGADEDDRMRLKQPKAKKDAAPVFKLDEREEALEMAGSSDCDHPDDPMSVAGMFAAANDAHPIKGVDHDWLGESWATIIHNDLADDVPLVTANTVIDRFTAIGVSTPGQLLGWLDLVGRNDADVDLLSVLLCDESKDEIALLRQVFWFIVDTAEEQGPPAALDAVMNIWMLSPEVIPWIREKLGQPKLFERFTDGTVAPAPRDSKAAAAAKKEAGKPVKKKAGRPRKHTA